jgi:GDPmannose 4,6-dehydratase
VKTALITGVSGQDGSYLAELLLAEGYRVLGLVRAADSIRHENLRHIRERIEFVDADLCDLESLKRLVGVHRPSEIYHLAARASSRTLVSDPVLTGEVNGLAAARILEAVRLVDPGIRVCQASSSEVFGKASESPQNESTPFRPRNPYGVAKLFAQGMVMSYREHYGLFACSCILFNHESPRRGPEFVTRKITRGAVRIKAGSAKVLELGDLDATRDWGYALDYVRAMRLMLQAAAPDDYVLATGESHSVREFCEIAFSHLGLDYRKFVVSGTASSRPRESARLVGDAGKARRVLGWKPTVSFKELVELMVDADARQLRHEISGAG